MYFMCNSLFQIGKGRDMKGFTLYRLGRIRNKWITDGLSEILSTFMLAVRLYDMLLYDFLCQLLPFGFIFWSRFVHVYH